MLVDINEAYLSFSVYLTIMGDSSYMMNTPGKPESPNNPDVNIWKEHALVRSMFVGVADSAVRIWL